MKQVRPNTLLFALTGLVFGACAINLNAEVTVRLAELAGATHFHGIAVDAKNPARLYLATHHGIFVVTTDGTATRISNNDNDYMGFTPHPSDPSVFYASGHPASGGNTGFVESRDGARSWRQLSPGVGGPVDFHQMDVSRANPQTIFGVFHGLQISEDGGHTWSTSAQTPPGLIDLATSASDVNTLYVATKQGLLVSRDKGQSWEPAHRQRSPATMVQAAGDGRVYAFVWELGLLRSPDDRLGWQVLSNAFGDRYLLHLAVDPSNGENLYAITNKTEILTSRDGGITWAVLN